MRIPKAKLRLLVSNIEQQTAWIAACLRHRRAEYRKAKDMGIDPDALADFIRERAAGKETTTRRRRQVSQLRRAMR